MASGKLLVLNVSIQQKSLVVPYGFLDVLKLINSHLLNKSDLLPVFKYSNHLNTPCSFLSFETLTCVPVIFDL